MLQRPPGTPLFPYTTLFRSRSTDAPRVRGPACADRRGLLIEHGAWTSARGRGRAGSGDPRPRSEEHTSELQSHVNLVCRLLLEKKNMTAAPFSQAFCGMP